MSLVVARKFENQLSILSDTKLTYPDHDVKNQKTNPLDGVIKTIILRIDVAISFAGEIEFAEQALSKISSTDSVETIIKVLTEHHLKSDFKTEFLLCFAAPEPIIYKFKNNEYGQVHSSWIGDHKAFDAFQESVLGTKKKIKKKKRRNENLLTTLRPQIVVTEMNLSMEQKINELFSKLTDAMDNVISDSMIDSVGGFKVHVVFSARFFYNWYIHTYRGEFAITGPGAHTISHGDAAEGAYTINFCGGSPDFLSVGLHIKQAEMGIIYHRKNNGLLFPTYHMSDEVDFADFSKERYNLDVTMLTQDRFFKFVSEGKKAFSKKEYKQALNLFDKAIEESRDKQKAEALFFKGVTLLNLKENADAFEVFRDAVKLDPTIQTKINMVFVNAQKK